MWEFEIVNKKTKETLIIFGYNFYDACKRSKLNSEEWKVTLSTYID